GWLAVTIASVNSTLARDHDLKVFEGAYVRGIAENSAAADAGIQVGDVVVKIVDVKISGNSALIETIGRHRPGDKVKITVNRKGKEIEFDVTLKNSIGEIASMHVDT